MLALQSSAAIKRSKQAQLFLRYLLSEDACVEFDFVYVQHPAGVAAGLSGDLQLQVPKHNTIQAEADRQATQYRHSQRVTDRLDSVTHE